MVLRRVAACGVRVGAEWLALSISGAWFGGGEGMRGGGAGSLLCGLARKRAQSSISPLMSPGLPHVRPTSWFVHVTAKWPTVRQFLHFTTVFFCSFWYTSPGNILTFKVGGSGVVGVVMKTKRLLVSHWVGSLFIPCQFIANFRSSFHFELCVVVFSKSSRFRCCRTGGECFQ